MKIVHWNGQWRMLLGGYTGLGTLNIIFVLSLSLGKEFTRTRILVSKCKRVNICISNK